METSFFCAVCVVNVEGKFSVMDIRNTTIEENFTILRMGDKLKTTSIKFYVGETKFPVYENANACPVKLFKQYQINQM